MSHHILEKVVAFCQHEADKPAPAADKPAADGASVATSSRISAISDWDKDFIDVDQTTLFEIILAANYLDIKPLLDLGCKTVANMIKGKTPEQIRQTFNIKVALPPPPLPPPPGANLFE